MAKIKFNNKNYNIDESAIAPAATELQSHLSTEMNGEGAKIIFGGAEYGIDSTKLSAEVADFIAHLATIAGNGIRVVVGGVEYNVDPSKVAGAMTELHTVFGGLQSDDSETLAAGLYETGAIALYQAGDRDGASAMMKTPWNELVDSGAIVVSEGPKLPENLPEINEYGFYFGVEYAVSMQGATLGFTFNEDSSTIFNSPDGVMDIPAGVIVYGDHTIDMSALNFPVFEVSDDGMVISADGIEMSLGESAPPKGEIYLGVVNGETALLEGELVIASENSISGIAHYAFTNQQSLTGVMMNNNIASIGVNAFEGCRNLSNVIISSSVTEIGGSVFQECRNLRSIVIPNSVTSIGNSAFDNCRALENVTLSENLISIDSYAFENCRALENLILPENLISIGSSAFHCCDGLKSITLPHSLTEIGERAFYGCYLKEVYISNMDAWLGFNFEKSETSPLDNVYGSLLYLNGELVTEVIIPEWVTVIGKAFKGCNSLERVVIPNGVTGIGDLAFNSCINLKNIQIADSVTSIGSFAFSSCDSLTSIDIPDEVTSIGEHAFAYCDILKSVKIPSSVENIGSDVFEGSGNLSEIIFDGTLTQWDSIQKSEWWDSGICYCNIYFASGEKIEICNLEFTYNDDNTCTLISLGSYDEYVVSVPECVNGHIVTAIGKEVFRGDTLTSITIPASVTHIASNAFYNCINLKSVYITDIVAWCGISFENQSANPLSGAGRNLYINDNLTTELTLPHGITSIEKYVFAHYNSLTSIVIPDSVTSIGDYAFSYCSSLESINIPDSVTSIGRGAFDECSSLISITLPDSVTSISSGAFNGCTNLTSITIPDSVTSIGSSAFRECSSLTSIVIPDGVTSIGDNTFDRCTNLTSITIPDSVTSIGGYAFNGCPNLTNIAIPDSVTSIGRVAFSDCRSLTSITIPDGVTSIGFNTFEGCSSLPSIVIPDSVTSIDDQAFSGCSSLTSVTFEGTVGQWNAITKGARWNQNVPATYVQCSDGQVTL